MKMFRIHKVIMNADYIGGKREYMKVSEDYG